MKVLFIIIAVIYLWQGRKLLRICDAWHKSGSFLISPWCAVLFSRSRRHQLSGKEEEQKKDIDIITQIFLRTKGSWFYSCFVVLFWLPVVMTVE